MGLLALWKAAVADRSNFLERVIAMLEDNGIRYCVIGGVGLNAYAEPVFTADLDIVIATDQLDEARRLAEREFKVREFQYSIKVYDPGSKLQVQMQRRPEMGEFLQRAVTRDVLGMMLPVAAPADLLRAKADAAMEPTRRASKRLKDFADIRRLVDAFPDLRALVPAQLRQFVFLDEPGADEAP